MAFEFSPYHNRNTGTIAALIQDQGNAQAEGVRRSGDAWAGAIQNIGQQVAHIPQQIQQQKQQGIQNAEQERALKSRALLGKLMPMAQKEEEGGITVWDTEMITKEFAAAGLGPEGAAASKGLMEINQMFRANRASQLATVQAGAKQIALAGNDPTLFGLFLDGVEKNGIYPKEMVAKFRQMGTSPEAVEKLTTYLAGPQKLTSGARGSVMRTETGQIVPGSEVPNPAADLAVARQTELERHNKEVERIATLTSGRADALAKETARHNRAMEARPTAGSTVVIQTVDKDGNPVSKIVPKVAGSEFAVAPTADMRNKVAARGLVGKSISAIKDLGDTIITKIGPAQRADAIKRGAEAVFGTDPQFRTYQDARMALAGNLAVGQQGSRPSDADIKAIWLPLVPDPYRDTAESAAMKWQLIKTMSNTEEAPTGDATAAGWTDLGGGVRVREKK